MYVPWRIVKEELKYVYGGVIVSLLMFLLTATVGVVKDFVVSLF